MSQAERMSSLQSRVNWITDELVVGLGRGNGRGRRTSLKRKEALGGGVRHPSFYINDGIGFNGKANLSLIYLFGTTYSLIWGS